MMDYTVVIPTLNEYENLKVLLTQLLNPSCEVLVCDNGSTDGTVELIKNATPNFNIRLSKGSGTVVDAILRGVRLSKTDKVVIMDGDNSHDPSIVRMIVKSLDNHDIVIGSRYIEGGGSKDSSSNQVISKGFNLLTFLLAPKVKDRASGFFGIKRDLAVNTPIRKTAKPMLEYLVRSNHNSVKEIPYTFTSRVSGTSKLGRGLLTILKELYGILLLHIHKFQKPIKFLIVGGIGMGINLGFLWIFTEVGHIYYILSSALAIVIATVWNYLCNNYWTFRQGKLL